LGSLGSSQIYGKLAAGSKWFSQYSLKRLEDFGSVIHSAFSEVYFKPQEELMDLKEGKPFPEHSLDMFRTPGIEVGISCDSRDGC
jgi:hypothetical protein